jgi:cell division septum initiation protein DivIVA
MIQQKKKKKKSAKERLMKGINGSISILLCLLLTPFLSITLGLVEYARYQEVLEITDEIYELTGISVLSDYDQYIHNRFGLLATSQKNALGSGADALLQTNAEILGNQITVDNPSFTGKFSLANTEVLRSQILDFSELTSTTAILAEDFNLEKLLDELQGVSQFQDVMNTVGSLADATDALSDAADALEELETALNNLKTSVETASASAGTLSADMSSLFQKLYENGIVLPESATTEEIETALGAFCNDYVDEFIDLYKEANGFISNLENIKTQLDSAKKAIQTFSDAVQKAKSALDSVASTNSADSNGKISEAAVKTIEDVLNEMTELIEDTLSEIKDETINTAKDTLKKIANEGLESIGLSGVVTRYSEIVNGSYFNTPLSDTAKQDLIDLLKTVREVCTDQDPDNLASGLTAFFKKKLVPDINIDIVDILDRVSGVVSDATKILSKKVDDSLFSLLSKLVNIVQNLFDLDVFYEENLNATVSISNNPNSPYQPFLDALDDLYDSIDTFTDAIKNVKLVKMLKALGKMLRAIGDLLDSIFNMISETVTGIANFVKAAFSGNAQELYEQLLISGYAVHNFPCRVDAGNVNIYPNTPTKVDLSGTGLTGFSFNNIARGSSAGSMFKGAELEYIMSGTKSETANQTFVFFGIYFLRLLLDLPSVFLDKEVLEIASAASVASWVIYILYIVAEPFLDTLLLVNVGSSGEANTVPLIRTKCWMTASHIGQYIAQLGNSVLSPELQNSFEEFSSDFDFGGGGDNSSNGSLKVDYHAHILLLLLFKDDDSLVSRIQTLIQLESTEYYGQQGLSFDMNQTYTAVEVAADVTFNPFFDLGALTGGSSLLPSKRVQQTVSY